MLWRVFKRSANLSALHRRTPRTRANLGVIVFTLLIHWLVESEAETFCRWGIRDLGYSGLSVVSVGSCEFVLREVCEYCNLQFREVEYTVYLGWKHKHCESMSDEGETDELAPI